MQPTDKEGTRCVCVKGKKNQSCLETCVYVGQQAVIVSYPAQDK